MSSKVNDKLNSEELTLEEKLALINDLASAAQAENVRRVQQGLAPIDPADATQCEGCQ